MKKITAVLVIFSLLGGNFSAAYAQMPGKMIFSAKTAKNALKGIKYMQPGAQSAGLAAQVERMTRTAVLGQSPTFGELRLRAAQGRTAFLPQAMLAHPVVQERAVLLRRHFPAAAGEASLLERQTAAGFWRADLAEQLNKLPGKSAAEDALADAAALGLFGETADIAAVEKFYLAVKDSPLAPQAAAVLARTLLVRGELERLQDFFIRENGAYETLQNGIAQYAQTAGLDVRIPPCTQAAGKTPAQPSQNYIQEYGLPAALAADPSAEATRIWLLLANTRPAVQRAASSAAIPAPTLKLPQSVLQSPGELQLAARALPAETAVETAAHTPVRTAAADETAVSAVRSQASVREEGVGPLAKNAPQTDNSGILYGGIPVPAMWKAAKQTWGKIKSLFTKKPAAQTPGPRLAAIQRAGIYMASYVMGLEVATPVIANFGSSFGLSLEENILVAVATYLPYSLGAIFSNWTKKLLGRKHSMNLGLALMGGGLFTGVAFCGLNGAFVPEADTLMHFYKALGCITVASLGGVLVHNSVGPMMTELSQNAGELVRQKRNAYTELSRAMGMASSFAFPFLATKVLGMDWSLAFALPLPLVTAAALGVNLAKLPNTKPAADAAQAVNAPKRGLKETIQNNEYIRLFKEEKGVGSFLGGLFIMNAVEMAINSGFLFLLPSMTSDQSSQYLFGLAQFAAPFLLGRYLAGKFLQWFPKHNMSAATLLAAGGGLASLFALDNVYALTAALFLAETGISTGFTLGFARTAKNPKTQDRVVSLIVASALSCAFGPLLLTQLAQTMIDAGLMSAETATAAAMIGIPSGLALLSAMLFKRVENLGEVSTSMLKKIYSFIKKSVFFPKQRRKRS